MTTDEMDIAIRGAFCPPLDDEGIRLSKPASVTIRRSHEAPAAICGKEGHETRAHCGGLGGDE